MGMRQYDAGVQSPPPGFPSHWGSSPHDPPEAIEPGDYGQQAPYPGYEAPSPLGPAYPQAGYGPPGWDGYAAPAAGPTLQQTISWIAFAVIGLLGLLGTILTATLWINLSSAQDRAAEACSRYGGEFSSMCREQIQNTAPSTPMALAICLFLIIVAGLAATGGAVMLFRKKQMGQFLILAGGIVMLVLSIGCEARYGPTSRITYDLVAGFVIAAAGGLMLVPAYRMTLGLPPRLTGDIGSGEFHSGEQWSYGQPQPPQTGPPGYGPYPPSQ
jgi:hypothetical protein